MALANVETNDPDAPLVMIDLRGTAPMPPMPDLGMAADSGTSPDGGITDIDGAVILPDGAVVLPDGAVVMLDGSVVPVDPTAGQLSGGACGCRVPSDANQSGQGERLPLTLTFLLLATLVWRRRR